MSRSAVNLKLVSAPPAKRTCEFCGGEMAAIEVWHGCPQRRLALGLHRLRIDARKADFAAQRQRLAERRAQRLISAAPS